MAYGKSRWGAIGRSPWEAWENPLVALEKPGNDPLM